MKTISTIALLMAFVFTSKAQDDKVTVYGTTNNQSIDLFIDTVELAKVKLDENSDKLILTPREMSRLKGLVIKLSQDTANAANGNKKVTENYLLKLVIGSTLLSDVVAEVSYEFPTIKFASEPVFGLKILDAHGLKYKLSQNVLTIEKAYSPSSSFASSLCPNASVRGSWFAGTTHNAEIRLIACSIDPSILMAREAVFNGIQEYGGSNLSVESKVPPPKKAVDRVQQGITIRFFHSDSEKEANNLQEFLAAMCSTIDVNIEDMRPNYPNGIVDYMEVWIK